MKSNIITYISLLLILFVSCNKDDKPVFTDRTVLVYIAGENSLNQFAEPNINSMIKGAADGNLNGGNLIVYVDKYNSTPQLLKITQSRSGEIEKEIIKEYSEHNSASIEIMNEVISEVARKYPAESMGLVLWSHGTAWLPSDYTTNNSYLRSFGEDKGENSFLEINELKEAIPSGIFDFIIFDACYMASIEVMYELRGKTPYILASPTEILGNGMPYEEIVPYWFSSSLTIEQILIQTGNSFYNYYNEKKHGYSNYPESASVCLVKTSELDNLAGAARNLLSGKEEEIENINLNQLQRLEHLRYSGPYALYDFKDFVNSIGTSTAFENALHNTIIYKQTTDIAYYNVGATELPISQNRFCGLSVYVPQNNLTVLNEWYKKNVEWYKAVYQ